jgi:hypothetical protein
MKGWIELSCDSGGGPLHLRSAAIVAVTDERPGDPTHPESAHAGVWTADHVFGVTQTSEQILAMIDNVENPNSRKETPT